MKVAGHESLAKKVLKTTKPPRPAVGGEISRFSFYIGGANAPVAKKSEGSLGGYAAAQSHSPSASCQEVNARRRINFESDGAVSSATAARTGHTGTRALLVCAPTGVRTSCFKQRDASNQIRDPQRVMARQRAFNCIQFAYFVGEH